LNLREPSRHPLPPRIPRIRNRACAPAPRPAGPLRSARSGHGRYPLLLVLLCMGLLLYSVSTYSVTPGTTSADATGRDLSPPVLRRLFARLDPSIVTVSTARVVTGAQLLNSYSSSEDDAFIDFVERQLQVGKNEYLDSILGSGFIVSADGYIVTAAHVLEDAIEVTVELYDHRLLPARIVGLDRETDVALLKVEAAGLAPIRFGRAGTMDLGDRVISIGAPFGLERSLAVGMINGKERMPITDAATAMLQTDVAVNPGSSGSPAFNLDGEVVGMFSMIYSYSGGFSGVSLAIPGDTLEAVVAQIKASGRSHRRNIGARFRDLPPAIARVLGIAHGKGVIVTGVSRGSAAAEAGLAVGDVILEFDGKPILKGADFLNAIISPGTQGSHLLKIVRDRRVGTLSLELRDTRPTAR